MHHQDVKIGLFTALSASIIPDSLLALGGKFLFAMAVTVVSSLVSALIRKVFSGK